MTTASLPYPELPYGAAPAWCFPATELSMYALFVLCVLHARKAGGRALAYLGGGLVFGLLLEYFEVVGNSYTYGHFWVMLGRAPYDVPVCIGCGWAIIMYTARLFSDGVGLPLFAAASFDTLLALNIDMSMDVVAYRLHMWHWYWKGVNPLTAQWFGIPYGNFVGWITVVFCYSAFSRIFERWLIARAKSSAVRFGVVALAAIACSLGVLVVTETWVFPFGLKYFGLSSARRLALFAVLLLVATVFGWSRRKPSVQSLPPVARWVPCWFHVFFVSSFFLFGFYRENLWMTAAACLNLSLGIAIHFYPVRPARELESFAALGARADSAFATFGFDSQSSVQEPRASESSPAASASSTPGRSVMK